MEQYLIIKKKLINIINSCTTYDQIDVATNYIMERLHNTCWMSSICSTDGLIMQFRYDVFNALTNARKKFYNDNNS